MGDAAVSDADVREDVGKPALSTVGGRRSRLSARTRFDLLFDTALFVAFVVAYAEDFTGLSLHEWFGIGFGVALLFHFSLHWEWVVRTTKGMFTTTAAPTIHVARELGTAGRYDVVHRVGHLDHQLARVRYHLQ